MYRLYFSMIVATILSAFQCHAQDRCNTSPLALEVVPYEHLTPDPAPAAESYLMVRMGMTTRTGIILGTATVTQHYHTGAEPLTLMNSSIFPSSIDSGATDSAYVLLEYDWATRPYYPVEVQLAVPYTLSEDEAPATELIARETFYVWFTPWGSVESWNSADFHTLKRQWLTPAPGSSDPVRIPVWKDSLPVTDVPDTLAKNDTAWWRYEPSLDFVDGLAYAIPKMRTTAPQLDDWVDQHDRAHDCGFGNQRFKYKVEGVITSDYEREFPTANIQIPLSNLRIRLYEDDFSIFDEFFGSAVTDDDGHYEISFSRCQTAFEGNEIELYLAVHAYDPEKHIYGKMGNGVNSTENGTARMVVHMGDFGVTGHTEATAVQNANLGQGIHLSVVQVRKAIDFCEAESIPVGGNINIWGPNFFSEQTESAFFSNNPFGLNYLGGNPGGRPTIHIHQSMGIENTVWHEFGHHVMYTLQNDLYLNDLTTSSPHAPFRDGNPHIAWTEGWATAFSFMCDIGNYKLDDEAVLDGNWEPEKRNYSGINVDMASVSTLTNGFQGENHIASAIYDLFDGQNMYSSYGIPPTYITHQDLNHTENYDRWAPCSIDDREYTALEICQPLLDNNTSGTLLRDAEDYLKSFAANRPTDEQLRIYEVFKEGRVCMQDNDNRKMSGASQDVIGITDDIEETVSNSFPFIPFTLTLNVSEPVFHNIEISAGRVFNLNHTLESLTGHINEDLLVWGTGRLLLNHNSSGQAGLISDPNFALSSSAPPASYYNVVLNHHARLFIGTLMVNNGDAEVVVGEDAGSRAFMHVRDGSRIDVAGGCRLIVNDGSRLRIRAGGELNLSDDAELIVHDGGEVIIEDGGIFNVSDDASIELLDPEGDNQLQLVLEPNAILGTFSGECYSEWHTFNPGSSSCDLPISGSGAAYTPACYEADAGADLLLSTGECEATLTAGGNFNFTAGLTYNWYFHWTNNFIGSGPSITLDVWQTTVVRLEVVDFNGLVYTDLIAVFKDFEQDCVPTAEDLHDYVQNFQASPNPTGGPLDFAFDLLQPANASLSIHNSNGIEVRSIFKNRPYTTGSHLEKTDLSDLPAGSYIALLQAGDEMLQTQIIIQ